jgi:hypothetical protein
MYKEYRYDEKGGLYIIGPKSAKLDRAPLKSMARELASASLMLQEANLDRGLKRNVRSLIMHFADTCSSAA